MTADEARAIRNTLLEESDKEMMVDRLEMLTPMQSVELQTYRQALRDIPEQEGFPDIIHFPIKPFPFERITVDG